MHYVFVTATNNVEGNPLLLWLNGGPGCSSLEGWLSEIGPCVFEDGQQYLNGSFNPYSWVQNASVIFLEAPAGVGFSWVQNEEAEEYNDVTTTTDMYLSLQAWFLKFPGWINHDFFIAGESYAGIYIPRLAHRIIDENAETNQTGYKNINIKGILVGNGVAIQNSLQFSTPKFLWWHQLIPDSLYNLFYDACSLNTTGQVCEEFEEEIEELTSYINPYWVYAYCFNDWTTDGACVTSLGYQDMLNNYGVQEALHVSQYNIEWIDCSNYVGDHYTPIQPGSVPDYLFLKDKIKILVYSGDADSVVPFVDTWEWLYSNFNVLKTSTVWGVTPGQIDGQVTIFDGIVYTTIKGAGHMVPAWRRSQAYYFFSRFINNLAPFVWQP